MQPKPLCARPTCQRLAKTKGHCQPHAAALGLTHKKVPSTQALKIINTYQQQGASLRDISESTGISMITLGKITNQKAKTTRVSTIERLKANPPTPKRLPLFPTQRRIQALRAIGFTVEEIAKGTGTHAGTLHRFCSTTDLEARTTHDFATRIARFYEAHHLDEARPEHPRIIHNMWPAPLDWDDIDNPDEVAVSSRHALGGLCGRGHMVHPLNMFDSWMLEGKKGCRACQAARVTLNRRVPGYSEEMVVQLSDRLYGAYIRREEASAFVAAQELGFIHVQAA